ncbi:MAG TPA: hypothetical protein VM925_29620 [Labilithrix sp.]|nr:hypothetical protein [Labilithrix sp.]
MARIGQVNDKVLSRAHPFFPSNNGPVMRAWPSSVLGKQLLVRRKDSVVVVTDGLSDPWDPELHPNAPKWTFGFELALEVPLGSLSDVSDEAIRGSWIPTTLWAATDWVAAEKVDIKGRLLKFDCATHAIPRVGGLEKLVGANGFIGGLLGVPYAGDQLCSQLVLAPEPNNPKDAIWLLPLKLLTADEYDWAVGVQDGARAKALAEAFLRDSQRTLSWLDRPSILPKLGVAAK